MKRNQLPNLLKLIIAGLFFVTISINLTAKVVTSTTTGTWATGSTWDGGLVPSSTDTVVIAAGDNVSVAVNTTVKKLTVNNSGYLTINSGKTLSIVGSDLTVNGLINGVGVLTFNTLNGVLSGTGSIENTGIFNVSKSISITSNSTLIRSGSISILAGATLTNSGTLNVSGTVNGATGALTAQFVNAMNSYLSVGSTFMTIGILDATATGNTIDYASTATRTVIATTYYNLSISGSGTKNLGTGTITVLGDLTCSGKLSGGANSLDIKGNYTNTNTFTYSTSTVTLSGATDQAISLSATTSQSFYNLIINKASGKVSISNNSVVRNALTMTSGNIVNTGFKLTLGSATTSDATRGVLNYTNGTIAGGAFERYFHNTQSLATDFLFPIGTATYYRPATVNYTTITTSGKLSLLFTETPASNTGLPITNGGVTSYNNFNDGQWVATGTTLVSTNYNLTLDANGFSAFPLDANSRILTSASGTWAATGTHGAITGSVLTRTSITGVTSSFAIASNNNCTLPALASITGNALPCKQTTVTYSIPNNVGSTYTWTLPAGASISGSTNTNAVDVVFDATTGTKSISVKETNSCGNGPSSTLSLNVGPVQPSIIYGVNKVAEGDEGIIYYVDSLSGYNYTWSISGGTIASGQSKGRVLLDFTTQGTSTLNVIAIGCSSFAPTTSKSISIAKTIISSSGIGEIQDTAMWNGTIITNTANISIDSSAVITIPALPATLTSVASLTIGDNSQFILNRNFIVSGNLVINGILNLNGFTLTVSGSDKLIRGTGTVVGTGTLAITGGSKTITADADLTIAGSLSVGNSVIVTNNGKVTIQTDLSGKTWVNGANSELKVDGNLSATPFTANAGSKLTVGGVLSSTTLTQGTNSILNINGSITGTLAATASDNVVNYGGVSQTIKATPYYDLNITGTGAIFAGATAINGDFVASSEIDVITNAATLTFSGTVDQNITTITNQNLYRITVNKASGDVLLGSDITVASTFTLTLGDFDLNGKNVTLTTPTALTSEKETSRVKGVSGSISTVVDLNAQNVTFTVLGATLKTTHVTNHPGSTVISRSHKSQGSGSNQTPERFYDITPTNNTGLLVDFSYKYLEIEKVSPTTDPTNLWRSTDISGDGNYAAPSGTVTVNNTTNVLKVSNATSFSRWVSGGGTKPVNNALPVEMSKFAVYRESNNILLDWTTTMEMENKEFLIEESRDGVTFEGIGRVKGVGTTNNLTNYTYNVINASESVSYFRLKQVDFDGKYNYSNIVIAKQIAESNNELVMESDFSVFPNPTTSNNISLKFNDVEKGIANVYIYDSSEKLFYSEEIDMEGSGVTNLYLAPSQTLAQGVYFIIVRTSTKTKTLKLIIE